MPGGGYSLIWPIRGCAAGQRMVFDLSILNRVYTFALVCPKQGIYYILPVCPNYKQDEICLYSNYTKVMTMTLIANKWLENKTASICLLS